MTNLLYANDRPGEYPASYYAATAQPLAEDPPLKGEIRADVCVIGAGYTGLSAALHLAQAGLDVVVLEAHRIGWGASGRNGGQVGSGQRVDQEELEEMFGLDQARTLWDLGQEAKALVKSLIARHRIDCDLSAGILYPTHHLRQGKGYREHVEHMAEVYGYEAMDYLPRSEVRAATGSEVYRCAVLDRDATHLHPLQYALGLARAAQGAGARIFERSAVADVTAGVPAVVRMDQGAVRADHVIYACNGYLGELEPGSAARVMPINNFLLATEPLGPEFDHVLPERQAVADDLFVINYFRRSADGRLIFGGGETYSHRFPKDIEALTRRALRWVYPELATIPVEFAWGGTLAITRSRLPYLARVAPNALTACGYSGHGVALATLSGRLLAEAVRGQSAGFDAMAAIPTAPFPGGTRFRGPLLTLAMSWFALRDRLGV